MDAYYDFSLASIIRLSVSIFREVLVGSLIFLISG